MTTAATSEVLVIGGGIVGLSIAYQLSCDGVGVTLLERSKTGREASWAGAGILPPASWYEDHPALDRLALAAAPGHAQWSGRLREETGIDDEYASCGATYLETADNAAYLSAVFTRWQGLGVAVEQGEGLWHVASEAQVRNPRRLRALAVACRQRGVRIVEDVAVEKVVSQPDGRLLAVESSAGRFSAEAYCFAAGAWTPRLAEIAGSTAPGRPVRGQMLLLRPTEDCLTQIVHRYPYYAVPRRDGRVLVGATVEEANFCNTTTDDAKQELLAAAAALHPRLATATIERHWSGLRPASADALPLIGPMHGVANAWIATGHHRCGLQLSPPTAQLISAMIRGEASDLASGAFDPGRFVLASASVKRESRLASSSLAD